MKSGIARKLADFGFLWGIRSPKGPTWSEIRVKIKTASIRRFVQPISGGTVWIYGLDEEGVPSLRYGTSTSQRIAIGYMAAEAVRVSLGMHGHIGERVEYVITQTADQKVITIYRAPKGMTMWDFLQQKGGAA